MAGPQVLASTPAEGDDDVARLGPFVARVDRLLLPRTVDRATVRLSSGEVRPLLAVTFDPIERRVVAVPFSDRPLEPNVGWRFVLQDTTDLSGRPMERTEIAFRTGERIGEPHREPLAGWTDVEPLLSRSCTGDGCHGPGPSAAALGLDLASPGSVRSTAINVVSRQLSAGTAVEGARGARALAGLPIFDVTSGVGRPATSYAIYKVLGDAHILGDAMPPPDSGVPPLTLSEQRIVAAWIRAGAPTE